MLSSVALRKEKQIPFHHIIVIICGILTFSNSNGGVYAAPQDFFFNFARIAQTLSTNANELMSAVPSETVEAAQQQPIQTIGSEITNLPSDLSTNINLLPVNNLIAASAVSEIPAPIQFVRNAMNSGLRR